MFDCFSISTFLFNFSFSLLDGSRSILVTETPSIPRRNNVEYSIRCRARSFYGRGRVWKSERERKRGVATPASLVSNRQHIAETNVSCAVAIATVVVVIIVTVFLQVNFENSTRESWSVSLYRLKSANFDEILFKIFALSLIRSK